MSFVFNLLLLVLAVPATLACGYLLLLTLLSTRLPLPPPSKRNVRFDVVVPAHNESRVIERTVASLRAIDWPQSAYRIVVVADNCDDDTAALARAAGAEVIERRDNVNRGKGYALANAFKVSRQNNFAQAVVVIDADAEVSTNLLEACAARIEQGEQAIQVHYGILNPWDSWRTRLITIAKAAFHIVRSRARERMRVSCGIRGNGWCVTHALLEKVPYASFSLTEDLEYGIQLGLAGIRVAYADEAHSNAEMVSSEQIARRQRQRWEGGRFQMIATKTVPLLRAAVARRSKVCLDLAIDLLVLPLSYVTLNVLILMLLAVIASCIFPPLLVWNWVAGFCVIALLAHVLRGWQLSGIGAQGLIDLARTPSFLFWKLMLMLRGKRDSAWVRTERE